MSINQRLELSLWDVKNGTRVFSQEIDQGQQPVPVVNSLILMDNDHGVISLSNDGLIVFEIRDKNFYPIKFQKEDETDTYQICVYGQCIEIMNKKTGCSTCVQDVDDTTIKSITILNDKCLKGNRVTRINNHFITISDTKMRVWDIMTALCIHEFPMHKDDYILYNNYQGHLLSDDNNILILLSKQNSLYIYDIDKGIFLGRYILKKPFKSIVFAEEKIRIKYEDDSFGKISWSNLYQNAQNALKQENANYITDLAIQREVVQNVSNKVLLVTMQDLASIDDELAEEALQKIMDPQFNEELGRALIAQFGLRIIRNYLPIIERSHNFPGINSELYRKTLSEIMSRNAAIDDMKKKLIMLRFKNTPESDTQRYKLLPQYGNLKATNKEAIEFLIDSIILSKLPKKFLPKNYNSNRTIIKPQAVRFMKKISSQELMR